MRYRRTLLWLFVLSLAVMGLLSVIALLLPDLVPKERELLWSAFLLTVYSLAGLVCSAAITRARFVRLAWTGTALLAVSLLVWLFLLWFFEFLNGDVQEIISKLNGTLTVFGIAAMHSALLILVAVRRSLGIWVRRSTIGAACIVTLWSVAMMWDDGGFGNKFLFRIVGAVAIVGSLGTIALPLLSRLEKLDQLGADDTGLIGSVPVSLTCPRCAHSVVAMGNKRKRCEGCGLKIKVDFEEPRCNCGYLLLGLTADVCPECGKAIPQQDRWLDPDHPPETDPMEH